MNIVTSAQRAILKRISAGRDSTARCALEILNCVDHGIVPSPEAIEWFIAWIRASKGAAA